MTQSIAAGIRYEENGNIDPPVVCLHGIGGNSESFRPQLDDLSRYGRIIAWNMPGYDGSPALENTTFAGLAGALNGFLAALDITEAHIIGQSIGGMIAQELALRYPERVLTLGLIATTPAFGGRDDRFKDEFLRARLEPLERGRTLAELAPGLIASITGPRASFEARQAAIQSLAAVPEASYRDILNCLVTFDRRADLHRITQRCCLLAGSGDNTAPARTMRKMAAGLAQAEFHEIAGAGHLVNLECPAETNRILQRFIWDKPEE